MRSVAIDPGRTIPRSRRNPRLERLALGSGRGTFISVTNDMIDLATHLDRDWTVHAGAVPAPVPDLIAIANLWARQCLTRNVIARPALR